MGPGLPLEAGGNGLQGVLGHPAWEGANLVEFLMRRVDPLLSGSEDRPELLTLLFVATYPIALLMACEGKDAVVRGSFGVKLLQRVAWGPDHCVEGILRPPICRAGFDVEPRMTRAGMKDGHGTDWNSGHNLERGCFARGTAHELLCEPLAVPDAEQKGGSFCVRVPLLTRASELGAGVPPFHEVCERLKRRVADCGPVGRHFISVPDKLDALRGLKIQVNFGGVPELEGLVGWA